MWLLWQQIPRACRQHSYHRQCQWVHQLNSNGSTITNGSAWYEETDLPPPAEAEDERHFRGDREAKVA